VLTATDARAVAEFRAYLLARKTVADYEAAATLGPTDTDRLLALVDRAERGALLPAEAGLLRAGIRRLAATQPLYGPQTASDAPEAPEAHPAPTRPPETDRDGSTGHRTPTGTHEPGRVSPGRPETGPDGT
jgi:hypothetical protein